VGGGILTLSSIPGAGGDFYGDLDHLSNWTPAMVISMVTEVELLQAGAQNLGQAIQDKGTRWVHLPVASGAVPDAALQEMWATISKQALRALSGGGRVMMQCLSGGGRSGMMALRLMIEAGEAADEAEARLRGINARAIGSAEQLRWALSAKRAPATFVRASHKPPVPRRA
jgi:protein-tyrosine phosphatase